jgi:acetyl esterase/lipase
VLFNPVFNNGPGQWGHARVGDHYKEFSPAHNITRDDPPAAIFLGSQDDLISVDTAKSFQTEMQKSGLICELHIYEGQKHGFYHLGKSDGKNYFETVTAADKFLVKLGWLRRPPTLQKPEISSPAKPALK